MLFAGIAARVNTVDLQFLVRREGRNQLALARVSVKAPSVVAALHLPAVKIAVGKRHATVGAGIMQRERTPLLVSPDGQRGLEQHGFFQAVAAYLATGQGAIPEAIEHQGIWRFALGQSNLGHERVEMVTQAAYYSRQAT